MTSVSVVICTLNRSTSLRATLECLTRQHWPQMEVVVVNGPSTDDTEAVLGEWAGRVKVRHCPDANLSMSRNIGIRAAAGEIVAFIDDDALPEFNWLEQATAPFSDPEVAGVGGIVFDHTGMRLQYAYGAVDRFGNCIYRDDAPFDFSVPGASRFTHLLGTNSLFRASSLRAIGGFDETYEYFLDETDVCCRLIDAGYRLVQLPNAAVHHKFLPSAVRNHERVVRHWYPIAKNHTYFGYRHALAHYGEKAVLDDAHEFVDGLLRDVEHHIRDGRLTADDAERARAECARGMCDGIERGWDKSDLRLAPLPAATAGFRQFETPGSPRAGQFVIVSSSYGADAAGGIGRFFSEIAPALVDQGLDVRVITSGKGTVDLEDGVWVHRVDCTGIDGRGLVPEAPPHVNSFATAAALEIDRIGTWSRVAAVYGPVWDVEVLGILRATKLPVVVFLATPLATVAGFSGQHDDPMIRALMDLEREVFATAHLFHANGRAVLATIAKEYPGTLDENRAHVIPLGTSDRAVPHRTARDGTLRLLFVGRLEVRKGIDTLLDALDIVLPQRPQVLARIVGSDVAGQPHRVDWLSHHGHDDLPDRVVFAGEVSDEQLHREYAAADIAVLPSRYESFGLVMIESMMHSVPVIACAAGGVPDVVRDGIDGLLVPSGDSAALADALLRLIDDAALREQLATAGRRRFETTFSTEASAARLVPLLDLAASATPAAVSAFGDSAPSRARR